MDLFRFDRADRIGTEMVIGVVVLIWSAGQLLDPVTRWIEGRPLLLDVGAKFTSDRVPVEAATTTDRLMVLAPSVAAVVLLGVGAWLVLRVLHGIAGRNPFARSQVRRLRTVAMMMLILPAVLNFATFVATTTVLDRHGLDVEAMISVPITWLLAGLATAAVAQAFADGASLRDDVDGLI